MLKDVEKFIRECTSCAKMKGGRTPLAPLGELPETIGPMEMTSIDICGPYPITRKKNRYLLTFIDHFTRYPEAIPITNQEASTVAKALVTQVFARHGCPQVLSSDRGTNFMSTLFQEMCKLLQIKRINSTAFNPKMQGKIERFHAGLNQTMSHYVNKYGNDWDDFVDYALMVHRATPHSTTKYSPYYLLHGRDMRMPNAGDLTARMEATEGKPGAQDCVESHISTLAERLDEAFKVVQKQNKISRMKQKLWYDKNTRLVTFSEGDYVYLKEMTVGVGKSKKFRSRWRGPYLVTKRFSDLNYQILVKPGKYMTVNVNRMKKCYKLPGRASRKKGEITPVRESLDDDWNDSDNEPLHLLGRPKHIPSLPVEAQKFRNDGAREIPDNDGLMPTCTETNIISTQEGQDDDTHTDGTIETIAQPLQEPEGEGDIDNDQGPPYPYSLRPLPGRRNYNSVEFTND
jgi:hypothetical protein